MGAVELLQFQENQFKRRLNGGRMRGSMKADREKNFVSCVVYFHNDETRAESFLTAVCSVMKENFEKFEVICVNDGCVDATLGRIQDFMDKTRDIQMLSLVNLSFFHGVESAMNAGRDLAVGDFIFEFDSCMLDFSPELVMEVYHRALEGYDVVAAAPRNYIPFTSKLFYALYNWGSPSRGKIRQERFRLISRRAINRVNQMNSYVPYRKALYVNCGLKMDTLLYDNRKLDRRGRNREEWGSRSMLAFDTIIIFTNVLERVSALISILFLGILLFVFGDIMVSLFGKVKPVEGWLSTVGLMSVGFFMLFIMLTLIFKYLSVILKISFRKKQYVIEGVEKLTK